LRKGSARGPFFSAERFYQGLRKRNDSAGDLLDVRYSGLGNIAHRAGKGALIIRVNTSDPHW